MLQNEEMVGVTQAATVAGVSAHTLRYYERVGLLTDVPRSASGRRLYGAQQLAAIQFITRLRATGMPIARILQYADLVRAGIDNQQERLAVLLAHHEAVSRSLDEQREHLAAIKTKIDLYQQQLRKPNTGRAEGVDTARCAAATDSSAASPLAQQDRSSS